jgi:phosphatidylglycerol---prolipoprotein diacylglyceryl transferase
MIDFTPNPVAIQIGSLPIYWYGIGYVLGLALTYWVINHEAERRGIDATILGNGFVIVAIAALIGGRVYHLVDQWQTLYANRPLIEAILPIHQQPDGSWAFSGFTGLGVYGGLITGTISAWIYLRLQKASFWTWADLVAPGLFAMQAVARWGNFFNQELYGPPTTLPWGIAIQCGHRIPQYACPAGIDPTATLGQHFHPLFLYESLSGVLGMLALLYVARRFPTRLRTGDLLGFFFVWYGIVRFALETLRADNWTFFGIPTAQIFSTLFILAGLAIIAWRHLRGAPTLAEVDATAREAAKAAAPEAGEDDEYEDDEDWEDEDEEETDERPEVATGPAPG